jgi:Zn-dependent protease with chaperone function
VVASWAIAARFLAGELVSDWNQPSQSVVSACFARLRAVATGRYGLVVQTGLLVLTVVAGAAPVTGRPHTIVITSAALAALDETQLGAVLCHERAHLAGRHHQLLAFTRALAAILPRIELFTTGAGEVARLLEMCADDTAARTHGAPTVLGALLALCGAASIPAGALGATRGRCPAPSASPTRPTRSIGSGCGFCWARWRS